MTPQPFVLVVVAEKKTRGLAEVAQELLKQTTDLGTLFWLTQKKKALQFCLLLGKPRQAHKLKQKTSKLELTAQDKSHTDWRISLSQTH